MAITQTEIEIIESAMRELVADVLMYHGINVAAKVSPPIEQRAKAALEAAERARWQPLPSPPEEV